MKKVTLEDIRIMAEASRAQLWEDARNMRRDVKIYLHWTAGRYGQFLMTTISTSTRTGLSMPARTTSARPWLTHGIVTPGLWV